MSSLLFLRVHTIETSLFLSIGNEPLQSEIARFAIIFDHHGRVYR
jgi:hypothetical protein